ncbi:MAG: hypothetical protein IPH85_05675 [Ignavibacteria bacterium]|nr:hypothetical protein [Ignavibacteria bacterium]
MTDESLALRPAASPAKNRSNVLRSSGVRYAAATDTVPLYSEPFAVTYPLAGKTMLDEPNCTVWDDAAENAVVKSAFCIVSCTKVTPFGDGHSACAALK